MTIELTAQHGARTFDVQHDLASLVRGRPAVALATRLRWLGIVICAFGAAAPTTVIFVVHWANGGLGQYALAYKWSLWLEVWHCVGWWLVVGVLLLWYASMQREIAWMALKQASTLWVIAINSIYVAALISHYEFGVQRSTWVNLPAYVGIALVFPLVAMADALPPVLRLGVLRHAGQFTLGCLGTVALVLRLPTANGTPGELVWTVMGVITVSNLHVLTYAGTVMTALLAEGVMLSWLFPNELAFIQMSIRIAELAGAPVPEGPHSSATAPTASCVLRPSAAEDTSYAAVAPSEAQKSDECVKIDRDACRGELTIQCADALLALGDSESANLAGLPTERPVVARSPRAVHGCINLGQPHEAWDPPSACDSGSCADASFSFGMDEADVKPSRPTARRASGPAAPPAVPSGMMFELTAQLGARTFDLTHDLASLVCGRSAIAFATRFRWLGIVICALGGAAPVLAVFVVHWANGGFGQFALAYKWPLWLEVWISVGWWLSFGVLLLWFASMQREIAWMALKQVSTIWVIAMTGVVLAALISLCEFGVQRSTWVNVPVYIGCALFFPLVAMADALPPTLRLRVLRFFGPIALGCAGAIALVLRLPMAKGTPGELIWTVMGTDTVSNLQALTYSTTVMTIMLAKGVLRSWAYPESLAFIQMSVRIAECGMAGAYAPLEPHSASAWARIASARVAPQPLNPN
jgi:hypothetical protein